MNTKIQKWGNSSGIRIPKAFLDSLSLENDDEVVFSLEKGGVFITKRKQNISTLSELLKGVTSKEYYRDYVHDEIGREKVVW